MPLSQDNKNNSSKDAYKTHLNYIKCMRLLTNNLAIKINLDITNKLLKGKTIKFMKLANLTWQSINGDLAACKEMPTFSQIAAPWIPVKCYYFIYYLETTFIYLLNGTEVGFGIGGHMRILKALTNAISNKEIIFTGLKAQELSKIVDWETSDRFVTTGRTIHDFYYSEPQCVDSVRGKLAEYIEYDWKEKYGVKSYRSAINKAKKKDSLSKITFSLLDFFYWMRIKANYRDLDFLDFDKDITEAESYRYIVEYVITVKNYSDSLTRAIEQLCKLRGIQLD